ncbi:MAG: hypothetical protein AABY15_07220 [Nanoarchaeota archaeon]
MSQAEKKVKFIKVWYTTECTKLNFGDRLKLARIWIDICLKDEEYEMAAAIKEERQHVIENHIKEKRSKRRLSQKIMIAVFLFKRKIRAWFKNKLSL